MLISGRAKLLIASLIMMQQLLRAEHCDFQIIANETLSSELLTQIEDNAPVAVCIAAVPPGGLARARYLCKRLRSRFPKLRIIVGRWGLTEGAEDQEKALLAAGADQVSTTLLASRDEVHAWLPALANRRRSR